MTKRNTKGKAPYRPTYAADPFDAVTDRAARHSVREARRNANEAEASEELTGRNQLGGRRNGTR